MAQWLNPETGEMEEKPDEGVNAFATQGAVSSGPGLSSLYQNSTPTIDYSASNPPPSYQSGYGYIADPATGVRTWVGEPTSTTLMADAAETNGAGSYSYEVPGVTSAPYQSRSSVLSFYGDPATGDHYFRSADGNYYRSIPGSNGYDGNAPTNDTTDFSKQYTLADLQSRFPGGFLGGPNDVSQEDTDFLGQWAPAIISMIAGGAMSGMIPGTTAVGAGAGTGSSLASQWAALEGTPTLTMGGSEALGGLGGFSSAEGFAGDYGLGSMLGDKSYWPELAGDSNVNLSNLGSSTQTSLDNMVNGFRDISQKLNPSGWDTSALNPEVSSLSNPSATSLTESIPEPIDYSQDPFRTTETVNKDYSKLTGYGIDNLYGKGITGLPVGTEGELKNIWKTMTNPIGGNKMNNSILSKLFKAPSPLEIGVRGLGALDSCNQGNKAQDMVGEQMNRMRGAEDSNAARGSFANSEWQKAQSDPMYGYDSFMQGAGRDFVNQARAAAAKSGSRGGYVNSGRMNSDLASLWQKNQSQRATSLAGGFANQPYSGSSSLTPGYASLIKNQNAPLFQGASGIMQGFKLADLFGED